MLDIAILVMFMYYSMQRSVRLARPLMSIEREILTCMVTFQVLYVIPNSLSLSHARVMFGNVQCP